MVGLASVDWLLHQWCSLLNRCDGDCVLDRCSARALVLRVHCELKQFFVFVLEIGTFEQNDEQYARDYGHGFV